MMHEMKGKMEGGAEGKKMMCKCPHHKMIPWLIVTIGVVFLFGQIGIFTMGFVNVAWPILVIAAGAMKLMEGKCKCC